MGINRTHKFPPAPEDHHTVWSAYFQYIYVKYGITEVQWQEKFKQQKGRCAICRKKARLVTDHDHRTGEFRGLLCRFCNGLLGKFEKYRARIRKYLA